MNKIRWNPADRPAMNIKENKGVTYLTYPALEELSGFVHAFSTRLGGVSEGIYSSMNLSFTRGDDENSVMADVPYLPGTVQSVFYNNCFHTR